MNPEVLSLLDLPPELKLHILQYVDTISLRQVIPLVNKEFRELSRDVSLYKRYEQSSCDENGVKTKYELNHELFRSNLNVLVIKAGLIEELQEVRFEALKEVVLDVDEFTFISVDSISRFLDKHPVNIHFRGRLNLKDIDKNFLRSVSSIETLVITKKDELQHMFDIPAKNYVITMDYISSDDIQNGFQDRNVKEGFENFNVGIEFQRDNFGLSKNANRLLLNKDLPLLRFHVVKMFWELQCMFLEHKQLFLSICSSWVQL